jgi:hypothetical protein
MNGMFVNCFGDCGKIITVEPGGPYRCQECQQRYDEERGQRAYNAAMTSSAKDKEIAMWGWQSLDQKTKVYYTPYLHGWFVDIIAPDRYFGHWVIHRKEEEAGAVVADLYRQFVEKRAGAELTLAEVNTIIERWKEELCELGKQEPIRLFNSGAICQ